MNIALFIIGCLFTHNIVFNRMLGVSDAGQSRGIDLAVIYGLAVACAMTLSAVCAWVVNSLILVPMHLEYLQIICFTLIAIVAAWLAQLLIGKVKPAWGEMLGGAYLTIAVNCAVLGVAFINAEQAYSFGFALLSGLFGGLGFMLALVLMAGVQEKIEFSKVPEPFKGMPIAIISAGLIALAFIGFKGIA